MTEDPRLASVAAALHKAGIRCNPNIVYCRASHRGHATAILAALPPDFCGHIDALDNAYRERNAVVAALIRTNGWLASLMAAPDAEGWWVVYAETPQGQVSWHIHPTDIRLFDDVPRRSAAWDGHDTDEKYERVAALLPAEIASLKGQMIRDRLLQLAVIKDANDEIARLRKIEEAARASLAAGDPPAGWSARKRADDALRAALGSKP